MGRLFQQNKNRLMKLQKKIAAISKKISIDGNSRICFVNTNEYYGVPVDLNFKTSYEDFSWEECDGKLFLMAGISIKWSPLDESSLFYNIKSRIYEIANTRSYFWNKDDKDVLADLEALFNISSPEILRMIAQKEDDFKKLLLSSGVIHHIKNGINQALSRKIIVEVDKKLYPRVKDRTRVPVLIYDAETDRVDYIDQNVEYSGSDALNSSKVRENILFDRFSDVEAKNALFYIPLNRWIEAYISKDDNLDRYRITLHFSPHRYG